MIDRVMSYRKPARQIKMHVNGFLWVDAADFEDYGVGSMTSVHASDG